MAPPKIANRRALLVFAHALALDLQRRGWGRRFGRLLQIAGALKSSSPAATAGTVENGAVDVHVFTSASASDADTDAEAGGIRHHPQQGTHFAERLENAVERLAQLGYEEVVLVGRDCPELQAADIRLAFEQLAAHRLVLGPDHRGGSYLIGLRVADRRALLAGVRWQRDTDFEELRRRAGAARTFTLAVKQDLDTLDDLRLLAASAGRWQALAARLLAALQKVSDAVSHGPPRVDAWQRARRARWQLPPPAVVVLAAAR